MTMPQPDNVLREEWNASQKDQEIKAKQYGRYDSWKKKHDKVADYWLKVLHAKEEEMVEFLKNHPGATRDECQNEKVIPQLDIEKFLSTLSTNTTQ